MSHESENSKTRAVVTHELNTADFSQAHVRLNGLFIYLLKESLT